MLERMLNLFGRSRAKSSTEEDVEKIVQRRSAHRVAELNEALEDGDTPVGHIASLILNIEMIRYRVNYELNPTDTKRHRADFVRRALHNLKNAPQTVLEPAGAYEPDITYVNILGNMGDGMITLRSEHDTAMVELLEDLVRGFARPRDELAQAILNDTYTEELWQKHAERAQRSGYV